MMLSNSIKEESCVFCGERHKEDNCASKLTFEERLQKLKDSRRCFRCFRVNHRASRCRVQLKCSNCKSKSHRSIMCRKLPEVDTKTDAEASTKCVVETPVELTMSNQVCTRDVALMTVSVDMIGPQNKRKRVRALIDTGTQFSHVSKKAVKEMNYKCNGNATFSHALFGGTSKLITHQRYKIHLKNPDSNVLFNFNAYDQDMIFGQVAREHSEEVYGELRRRGIVVEGAIGNSEVDVLIGADVAGKLLTGSIVQLDCGVTAIETHLGWTLIGKDKGAAHNSIACSMLSVCTEVPHLAMEERLWDMDVLGIKNDLQKRSKEEMDILAMGHFRRTVSRNADGRYCVKLPWIGGHPELPTNEFVAKKRLEDATHTLERNQMYEEYDSVFNEWRSLSIIEKVPDEELRSCCHYLPHHPVIREESSTTKVRPVFDASCRGQVQNTAYYQEYDMYRREAISLNDCLVKGPNLLDLIPDLLLSFRENP